ncbi:Methionyl-tRNA formyltransferase [Gossypium arboreum]|uniref:Methionyl-tRNA formyltransferase n=1 Tax=Gossypium arboreum TaxID=29729 RepID=A0A0B0NPH9_GOSAR|nr:Methionyl-tRNA formyltransferase [Gossypium arboreum]
MAEGSALQCKKLVTTETFEERLENKLDAVQTVMQSEEMRWDTYHEYRYESKQADETTMQCENLTRKEINKCSYSIGYPKGYSENFRKLYRSMNAPVPKPLPSLVELRNAIKRMMPGTITAQSNIPVIRASQVGANCVLDESGQELAEGEKFMICQCFSWCQQQRYHDQSSSDKICLANTVFVTHG